MQALTEKRHTDGGCAGIFSHFFNRNTPLSNKNIHRAVKKLQRTHTIAAGGNKLLLIGHERYGGFPGVGKPENEVVRSGSDNDVGLVARLMGLESMPASTDIKPKHPKLEDTGGGTACFSTDAQSKTTVMLLDKRRNHHKLPTPAKSPMMPLSRVSTARLMQMAAAKILEPRLLSSTRARCSLTYNGTLQDNADKLHNREAMGTSCDHSGSTGSSHHRSIFRTPVIQSRRVSNAKSIATPVKNVQSRACDSGERKAKLDVNLRNKQLKSESTIVRDRESKVTRACSRKQGQRRGKNELGEGKSFITPKRNSKEYSPVQSAAKVSNNVRFETVMNCGEKNFARKRRSTAGLQIENVGMINAKLRKQTTVSSALIDREEEALISSKVVNHHGTCRRITKRVEAYSSNGSKDNGIVSCTFSSSTKQFSTYLAKGAKQDIKAHGKPSRDHSCSNLRSDTKAERVTLRGVEVSNLLQQKIKQLTSLDEGNMEKGKPLPPSSNATILVELISALTTEASTPSEKENNCSGHSTTLSDDSFRDDDNNLSIPTSSPSQMLTLKEKLQEEATTGISASFLVSDADQPSPISILEASFSSDSCSLGSPCSSGGKPYLSSTGSSGKMYMLDFETDLLDSATSTNTMELDQENNPHPHDKEPGMPTSCLRNAGFSKAKVNHISKAIANAHLLFKSSSLYESDASFDSWEIFVLSMIETNLDIFRTSQKCSSEEENQMRDLLFECIIECFESKYSSLCNSGYKEWLKLYSCEGQLRRELNEDIRGWADFSGRVVDDLVETEIRLSTSMWTQFDIEGYEIGIEIENEIFDAFVDEIVIDMCCC